ncbi:MAG TPA: hypothetical protein VF265_05115 [Nevskiaceae bacterium]
MSVRATYALDKETDQRIRALAKVWGVSQAEVIRRSVGAAADAAARKLSPADVVAWYRSHRPVRSRAETRRWIREAREWRHADDRRRGPPVA